MEAWPRNLKSLLIVSHAEVAKLQGTDRVRPLTVAIRVHKDDRILSTLKNSPLNGSTAPYTSTLWTKDGFKKANIASFLNRLNST